MFRTTQLVTAAWICLAVVGCGGSKQVIVPLKGKVLYKGNPVTYGQVMLQPDNGIEMARGEIQPDGSFVLTTISPGDGATVGKNFVRITSRPGQKQDLAAEAAKGEIGGSKVGHSGQVWRFSNERFGV